MRKRGTPLPINGALNRTRTMLGLELGAWMVIVFVSIAAFLVGLRLTALATFGFMVSGAWLVTRKHPKMFQLWGQSLQQKSYYDPRKT